MKYQDTSFALFSASLHGMFGLPVFVAVGQGLRAIAQGCPGATAARHVQRQGAVRRSHRLVHHEAARTGRQGKRDLALVRPARISHGAPVGKLGA